MVRIRWTEQAAEDLSAIHAYVARDSEESAALVASRIVEAVDQLADFPLSGRTVPEIGREDVRELIREPYRIVYRHRRVDDDVEVVTIFHGRRLFPREEIRGRLR